MLDLNSGTIIRGGVREPIVRWGVWFKTPFGYGETLEEARETVISVDLNPHMVIQPVPVAFGDTIHEVYDR